MYDYVKGKGYFIGEFNEEEIRNNTAENKAREFMKESGLKYTNTEVVYDKGVPVSMKVYICGHDEFKI